MLEPRSALAAVYRPGQLGVIHRPAVVAISERRGRALVQLSGWPGSFESVCDRLERRLDMPVPRDCRGATECADLSIFRVGPERLWLAARAHDARLQGIDAASFGEDAVVTELGHSRTVLRITGSSARALLNRGLPVDLDDAAFPVGAFVQSAIHHVPVLVYRNGAAGDCALDAYVPREYSVTFWEWLTEHAASLGGLVGEPE
ncbi:MAG: hypothetical protein KJ011_00915 [Burkholderiaceae bacterium]|nr:hypothetical protein [Burkholderiaceae bacterium]